MSEELEISVMESGPEGELNDKNTLLALLPIKNVVILPKSIIPIIVGRKSSIRAVEHALKTNKAIIVSAQKSPKTENPKLEDIHSYGTRATILQVMRMPNKSLKILVEGICRTEILDGKEHDDFWLVSYQDLFTTHFERNVDIEATWRQLRSLYSSYARLNDRVPADLVDIAATIDDMDCITDTIAIHLNLTFEERQEILELIDLKERMLKVALLLKREIDILETELRIKGHIQSQVEKNQREYYLTEQIKAIQKELGREDLHAEITSLREKIATLKLPVEAAEKVEKELKRLEQMPPMSSEASVGRHYIDWIITLPWHTATLDEVSLAEAEKILNDTHAGLDKPKERIIEFLAARKFSGSMERSPIICLIGPPGVGKTSLAKSVSESLGRKFVRISLGGVRDEAEIRGHRRTYIGALPGKIVHAMKKAGTINPVILLDEIDKMSRDFHGDPAAALLEVLDPEQNKTFTDHFLDLEYDLSKVMFITTANHIEGIPYPLLDRMELIQLSGYTDDEKIHIAQSFLIPKKLKEYSLNFEQCNISENILRKIINEYTKEAGVRQLERVLAKIMRKSIQLILKKPKTKTVIITPELIQEWLGYPKYRPTSLDTSDTIGLVTGLAWTEVGGDVLEIEASIMPGKGNLTLTGQLGEVMQESAQAALSYIRSRANKLGLTPSFSSNKDIHIHVPEGATPKDGPSAGIAICLALASALTKNPVKLGIAMTGEITLRGRVLAIGGLKEKLLAAKRYNAKTVIIPQENFNDFQEVKKDIGSELEVKFAQTMDEVLEWALTKNPFDHDSTSNEKKDRASKNAKKSTKKTISTTTKKPKTPKTSKTINKKPTKRSF
jgi:ATP-dependent Lon protease